METIPGPHNAIDKIKEHFGDEAEPFFVFAGTAANVLGLDQITNPFHSIICADSSHIHNDECDAPERFTGCKLLTVPSPDGKLTIEGIQQHMHGFDFEHHSQPKVISITQATELGGVYQPNEIITLADFAHKHNMLLHMDGARLANAAAHLGLNLRQITTDAGVDVLSFGGTKNGLMFGECILFFQNRLTHDFKYIRKQGMQLASKMRFIAAQYTAYLTNDLWLRNAQRANEMTALLHQQIQKIPPIQITQKVESNAIFATLPKNCIPELQKQFFFYVWNEAINEVRWMTSFDTTPEDINQFTAFIQSILH